MNFLRKLNPDLEGIGEDELDLLLKYIRKGDVILEIGVFKGQTTRRLSEKGYIIGIDRFTPLSGNTLLGNKPIEVYSEFIRNTIGKIKVLLFPTSSEEAFDFWDRYIKTKIDFIFVDGGHTFEDLVKDIRWIRYLNEDGFVAFHDTHLEEVNKFLLTLGKEYKFMEGKSSLKIFQVKK